MKAHQADLMQHAQKPEYDEAKLRAFLLSKWRERAAEIPHRPIPDDLSSACKFVSLFVQALYGGEIRGNRRHQFVVLNGEILDPCRGNQDVLKIMSKGLDPHEHDPIWFGNPDHQKSMATCNPRVKQWLSDWMERAGPPSEPDPSSPCPPY